MDRVRSGGVIICALAAAVTLHVVMPLGRLRLVLLTALGDADLRAVVPAVCGAAAWLCLGWVCVVVTATLLSAVPGRTGWLGRRICALSLPTAARPVLAGLLGLALLQGGPATAAATPWSAVAGAPDDPLTGVSLDWPVTAPETPRPDPGSGTQSSDGRRATPPAGDGAQPRAGEKAQPRTGGTVRRRAGVGPPTQWGDGARTRSGDGATVRVRPGDTLWSLAARSLGPSATTRSTASEWPRWWTANRTVIGPDPDLIRPGQRLRVPDPVPGPAPPAAERPGSTP